ncbi:MAG: NADH-quinone oxidoreductase subunit M [Opitutales bacterium]|nr:NADH-quinone oxidoreductase subunit M [Opitutales bacterium]
MNLPEPSAGLPILSILIFAPLIAAAVALLLPAGRAVWWWTLFATSAVALFSLSLLFGFDSSTAEFQFVEHRAWIPLLGMEYALGIDGISLLLVLLTTLITPFCVLASWTSVTLRTREFMVCMLIMQTAMTGVFTALDFVLFFIFWESMLIPMSILIGVWGGAGRVYAAIKFFIYTMAGSVLLIVAIIALRLETGTFSIPALMDQPYDRAFQLWIFGAFFISFAIKVPMFPFHTWLPHAHVQAPTAGSVLLASILLKMGTYGFLRFCLPITPLATVELAPFILWLSIIAIVYGGLAALAQSDLKKIVAYSSVGHMGFATLGIFSLVQNGTVGGALVMINHGVTTGALFIAVGILYERLHTRDLAKTAGVGKHMPVFAFFLGMFCLSSLAFPGTNSFIGEFLVLGGAFEVSLTLAIAAVPGVVIAAAYNLRILQRVAYGGTNNPDHSAVADLGLREILLLTPFLVFILWIGLQPAPFIGIMEASIENILEIISRAGS